MEGPLPHIRTLTLTRFRNYAALAWSPPPGLVGVVGPNGSGKTNLLEAISLLSPGRGLRNARTDQLARQGEGGDGSWAVHARILSPTGPVELATGVLPGTERRQVRIDGDIIRGQAELGAHITTVWLTPQMDRLFQEGPAGRRRFLDRLVYGLEPAHAREVAAQAASLTERARLLAMRADPAWLAAVEDSIARHATAVTASRLAYVTRLNDVLVQGGAGGFPPARLDLNCAIATRLSRHPAVEVEDWLRAALRDSRETDGESGTQGIGAHRSDLLMKDAATGRSASIASTGQQKALLIGVTLGHAVLLKAVRGRAPVMLLDEPMTHLDAERRRLLLTALRGLGGQGFLTATDRDAFDADLSCVTCLEGCLHPVS
ncbi:DNA replication and repair protein recF [Granulibacter bethesdensis]|uniref:DNA replication and repair protein RecF n=1 Tax=Granulibacter bethesdensis (strain ATCC BAA-1260 / CGDNIH1) TaxID=391165 RepID=Q0BVD4_GRABC|nr:DNA replication and repair protein recF [Granulibacter bethesdensis CGDNIH1]AHJ67324.1 DNA replication and repair protein recF [Granulibacter bethesdensis]APH51001.1 DNA replication and repair protein recF [Granulibacter bethesdensis]APH63696.1 DNA replication and repair protein recF [Granulibacter bethesdensis]